MEKEHDEQKQKEKKQLDAEIEYDKWVQRALEKDLIKKEDVHRKKMRKQLADQRKEQKKQHDREESQAKVSQWMHEKGFIVESQGRPTVFDKLARQSTRNVKKTRG